MFKKSILSGLCLTLVFALCACQNTQNIDSSSTNSSQVSSGESKDEQTPPAKALDELTLAIDSTDSFNPYKATSLSNLTLMPLLYDSLVKINPEYGLDYELAESVSISGSTITVTLRTGIHFTNGAGLSATDVVYSLNAAKSEGDYMTKLDTVTSVVARGNDVVIELSAPDSLFAYALDIPIVQENSLSDTDAIGSGRYSITEENAQKILIYNTEHYKQQTPTFVRIPLIGMPSWDAMTSSVKIGRVGLVYTDDISQTATGTGAEVISGPLNHMMFVGVNSTAGITMEPKVRQAISLAIDRDKLLSDVYNGNGYPTIMPFHPLMKLGELPEGLQTGVDNANALFDEAGFTEKDTYDARLLEKVPLTIDILIPQDSAYKLLAANSITEQLRLCGVKAIVTQVDAATYLARIEAGEFQLYIGEMLLESNMSLSPFLTGGSASYGITQSEELHASYQLFLSNAQNYTQFATQFNTTVPFIPLVYGNASIVHSRDLYSEITPSISDLFYNIADWK